MCKASGKRFQCLKKVRCLEQKCRGCVRWQCGKIPLNLKAEKRVMESERQGENTKHISEIQRNSENICVNNITDKFLSNFYKLKVSNFMELGSEVINATKAKDMEINPNEGLRKIVSMKRNNPVHEGTKNHGKKNVVREMNICFNNNKDRFLDLFLVQQKWSKKDESTNRKDVEQRIPREKEKSMIKNQHMTINNNTCANHNWKDIFGIVGNSADMSKLKLSKDRRRRRQAHTKSREKLKEICLKIYKY